MAYTNTLVGLTPILATSHLRRCTTMFKQPSSIVWSQLYKTVRNVFKLGDQATYRQSTIRWLVLEFEPLNEALSALTIAATVCLVALAFRFPFASIIAPLLLPCVLLLGFVSISLRLAPCTSLVWVPVQRLDA